MNTVTSPSARVLTLLALSLPLSLGVACKAPDRADAVHPAPAAPAPAAAPAATPGAPEAPAGMPMPVSSRGAAVDPSAAPAGPAAAGLTYQLPASWQPQPPASAMRLAQAVIPGQGGPGELAVFFFGVGGGGPVEANLERWIGQVEATGPVARDVFDANGLRVTWVEVAGTLKPSGMGQGPTTPQPGSRLYGAVVEGPGGPWFFKATGPDATLTANREAWLGLLKSVRLP